MPQRINAAGRIGSPSDALSLLTEEDPDEAEALAEKICGLNAERKNYENAVLADIYEKNKGKSRSAGQACDCFQRR
ncbi:MAG: hypothetical protein ACLSHR_06210 [Oscillospiraceae bacterium]